MGVVRLAAAGIAHRLELDLEQADDLKLAVTEACGHLLGLPGSNDAPIEIDWHIDAHSLAVTVQRACPKDSHQAGGQWSEIGLFLIHALMDEVDELDTNAGLRMVKHLSGTSDG